MKKYLFLLLALVAATAKAASLGDNCRSEQSFPQANACWEKLETTFADAPATLKGVSRAKAEDLSRRLPRQAPPAQPPAAPIVVAAHASEVWEVAPQPQVRQAAMVAQAAAPPDPTEVVFGFAPPECLSGRVRCLEIRLDGIERDYPGASGVLVHTSAHPEPRAPVYRIGGRMRGGEPAMVTRSGRAIQTLIGMPIGSIWIMARVGENLETTIEVLRADPLSATHSVIAECVAWLTPDKVSRTISAAELVRRK